MNGYTIYHATIYIGMLQIIRVYVYHVCIGGIYVCVYVCMQYIGMLYSSYVYQCICVYLYVYVHVSQYVYVYVCDSRQITQIVHKYIDVCMCYVYMCVMCLCLSYVCSMMYVVCMLYVCINELVIRSMYYINVYDSCMCCVVLLYVHQ